MARQKRLHVPHATYYVVDRFTPGLEILVAHPGRNHAPNESERIAANRRQFEDLLSATAQRWGAHVDAYCWLPDAALLILQVSLASLECVMHSLHGAYSHYLHTTAGIDGRSYPGRYRALLVDPDVYLLDFCRHLTMAAVRLCLSKSPLAYPHSSVNAWVGGARPKFLAHSRVPEALARRGMATRPGIERFLAEHHEPGFLALLRHGSPEDRRIAGDAEFVREVRRLSELVQRRTDGVDSALRWVVDMLKIDPNVVTSRKRSHEKALTRALAAWLITSSGAASLSETARDVACGKATLHEGIDRYSLLRPDLFNETTLTRYVEFLTTA
jgi:hypothetical protein